MSQVQRLDSVVDITMGQAPEGESYNVDGNGMPLMAGAGDFGEVHPAPKKYTTAPGKTCQAGDIILGIRATIGEKVLADRQYCLGRGVAGLRARPGLDGRYLWHWLTHAAPGLATKARGATFKQVNREDIRELRITVLPLDKQRRIAEILDKADALRAKRQTTLAQLDTLTQSIFLDMFGDPATNPKGWPVKRLDSVCGLVNGRAFKPTEWEESGLPIIRIQNLNDGSRPFNHTTQELPERFTVRTGDILFSWSGTPGTSFGCFRWNGPEGWLNQHIFNVRLNGEVDGDYFIAHVNLKLGELIAKAHGGVGLQHVTKAMVDETILMIPAANLQADFAHHVARVEELRTDERAAAAGLDALFTSLQHRAFGADLVTDKIGGPIA